MEQKKVSVIIPCYNSEPYLRATLGFVLDQYYKNIEIVCVNNGSEDGTAEILREYAEIYNNIKVVSFEENQGLFGARLAGAAAAEGAYIIFMDSDDEITPGWISSLVGRAEETGADLVLGDVEKKGDLQKKGLHTSISSYQNLEPLHLADLDTDGQGMMDTLMRMHGLCSHYHYIWNKLIRRDLWEKSAEDFASLRSARPHLVMGEDLAFSVTLYCHAEKVCNIHHEYYVYCFHEGQNVKATDIQKFLKNLDDLIATFEYFREILKKYGYWEKYEPEYIQFRQRYGIIYLRITKNLKLPQTTVAFVRQAFLQEEIDNKKRVESEFFFSLMTNTAPIYHEYRKLIDMIYSEDIKVVSFDVFDTLILRPFGEPSDIFTYLNEPFAKVFHTNTFVDFSSQRRVAEEQSHKLQKVIKPGIEEPTLDEIYDVLADLYGYEKEKLARIKEQEMENEVRFSYARKFGAELFALAKRAGKRIILASDMYLPRECIVKILRKCGIEGYEKLYLSSEMHLTKHYGTMYPAIIDDLSGTVKPRQILHIGDNYQSDVENPKKYGMQAMHLPRTVGLLQGRNPGIYTGQSFNKIFKTGDRYHDMSLAYGGFTGMRSLCAVVANKIFDFPYVSFNRSSDLNADPRFIGYFPLGMHIYAVARWLIENTRGKGYRRLHFVARDGYMIKRAYDILSEGEEGLPESNYLRASRKAFAIADIRSLADMHSVVHKMNFMQQSPDSIFELFEPVMSEQSKQKYLEEKGQNRPLCSATFKERTQFDSFIVRFYESFLKDAAFEEYGKNMAAYFGEVFSEKDVLFDTGYSGRIEVVLNKLLGYKISSFYIHTNTDLVEKRKRAADIDIRTFYGYKPMVTGIIREHVLAEMGPSTIGYREQDGSFEPVFEKYDIDFPTWFVTDTMQKSAIEFVSDVKALFGRDALTLACRPEDVSRPFEYYLHFSRSFDRNVFSDSEFEDDLGEGHVISGLEFWNRALARISDGSGAAQDAKEPPVPSAVRKRGILLRALYFLLFDRRAFKEKLKKRFGRKKVEKK